MSEPRTARDHALRVAALEALKDAVEKEYEKARKEAEPVFADKYRDGNPQQHILLGDEKIGQLTIKTPLPVVSMLNGGLESWAEEHIGDEAFEEFIPDSVKDSREVLAIVKAANPALVGRRLRPAEARKLMAELLKSKPVRGFLEDKDSGEKEQVGTVSPGTATGAFAFTDGREGDARRARIMAALLGGDPELRELVGFGPLALPAGGSDG